MNCPVCNSLNYKKLTTIKSGELYFCINCKSNFLYANISESFYKESYFDETYEAAYGKSYLDDEQNIRNYSRRRLKIIKKFIHKEKAKLLDIGSALGFFCDEAKNLGFIAKGLEISEYARTYAKNRFGIECYKDLKDVQEKFDVITLWFTLEHIENPDSFIFSVSDLLNNNGILALSVPNGYGGFYRFNRKLYFQKRPIEHIFEPSIRGMKILLKKNNFKIKKIEIFGLHPDRFGIVDNNFTRNLQKFLRLGDTFEIYAEKK
ncbi:MAG: class I SAM-dependent methyltransferase [Brevinematales bacterium]|nr:class I SAM-dependent methyltransferase [Brevinematales bacterium]